MWRPFVARTSPPDADLARPDCYLGARTAAVSSRNAGSRIPLRTHPAKTRKLPPQRSRNHPNFAASSASFALARAKAGRAMNRSR